MKLASIVAVAAAATSMGVAAQAAGLSGTTVGLQAYFPDMATVYSDAGTAVVGPGVEFGPIALTGYPLSFDLSDDQITITSTVDSGFDTGAFNGFDFTFSTAAPTGATIDAASGFDPVAITFVGDELFLNYEGVPVSIGETSVIDLTFGGGVPEPASWTLMLVGVAALGGMMRRRMTLAQ